MMRFITTRLNKGSAARDIATLTVGTAVAQGIAIAATPFLTRLFTPSDFGLLAVFLAVAAVGSTLVTLRFETSILVPKENTESANLVLLSLILGVSLSTILAVVGMLLPINIQEKIGLATLHNWLPIALLAAGAISVLAVMQGWMNRQKKYLQIAWLRIGQSVCITGLAIIFGLLDIDDGLLIAQVCASFLICIAAMWLGRSVVCYWEKKQTLQKTAVAHQNAPKFLLPTALLDVFTLQLPVILIATWFTEIMAGQFSMAWRLLMLPMALLGGAIGQVFLQKFSLRQTTVNEKQVLLKKTWLTLAALGVIPTLILFFFGQYIFKFILGADWIEAGVFASILAPMALAIFVSSPTSGTFIILGIQKYGLYFGIASLIYRPTCLFVGYINGNLMFGLQLWVIFEIVQIALYQRVAWLNLRNVKID